MSHPGKGAYPLPSTERGFRSCPRGADNSSLWAALQPLRQVSSHCNESPGPGPVFKGFCPRRRRLHSPVARPSWTPLSSASLLLLPPHQARGPAPISCGVQGRGGAGLVAAGMIKPRPGRAWANPLCPGRRPRPCREQLWAELRAQRSSLTAGLGPWRVTALVVRGTGITVAPRFPPGHRVLANGPRRGAAACAPGPPCSGATSGETGPAAARGDRKVRAPLPVSPGAGGPALSLAR